MAEQERKNVKIGFFDSGAGGLSVLDCFVKKGSFTEVVYFGDNENAPYGGKNKRELTALAAEGVGRLTAAGAEIVVLACGTMSVNVLSELREIFPQTPIFGVFPPVERCVLEGTRPAVLFATPATAKEYKNIPGITAIALPFLAAEIEDHLFSLGKVCLKKHLSPLAENPSAIVIGCTHYALIGDRFKQMFPNARFYFGAKDALRNVEKFLKNKTAFLHGNADENLLNQNSDHFLVKKEVGVTTFDSKSNRNQIILKNSTIFGYFYGKKVNFIGNSALLNFDAYTNICSNLTKIQ